MWTLLDQEASKTFQQMSKADDFVVIGPFFNVNTSSACDIFCHLLINFVSSLDSYQA